MKITNDYQEYISILTTTKLFQGIPVEQYESIFSQLNASIYTYQKDEIIQHLGNPFLTSGIVLDGIVEGSFISENYNKISINHFNAGQSYGEALAFVQTGYSPIQIKALTECTVLLLHIHQVNNQSSVGEYHNLLTTNLITILAKQNIFSNLKLRITSQKSLRDRILIYLYSLAPDDNGYVHVPFNKTSLAEFLGVNRSALSRELGRMQDEGLIIIQQNKIQICIDNK